MHTQMETTLPTMRPHSNRSMVLKRIARGNVRAENIHLSLDAAEQTTYQTPRSVSYKSVRQINCMYTRILVDRCVPQKGAQSRGEPTAGLTHGPSDGWFERTSLPRKRFPADTEGAGSSVHMVRRCSNDRPSYINGTVSVRS